MDPLTAFSLAAGVVQIVDVSIRAATQCRQIYETGTTAANQDVQEQAESLRQICDRLEISVSKAPASQSQSDADLKDIVQKCIKTAEELLGEMDGLQASSKRQLVPKFIKGLRKSSHIKEMQQKLESYQTTLDTKILSQLNTSSLKQESNLEKLDDQVIRLAAAIDNGRKTLEQIIANQNQSTKEYIKVQMQMNQQVAAERADRTDQEQNLRMLPVALSASYKSNHWQHESRCLPGTRVAIIEDILKWSKSSNSEQILWLNGMAGTGKSTIARTIARTLDEVDCLAASFFFSRDQDELCDAKLLFTTLADQIATKLPTIRPFISNTIAKDRSILHQGLSEQWEHLVFKPISEIQDRCAPRALIIVIDALDECQSEKDIQLVVQLLSQSISPGHVNVRFLVTSRPESSIRDSFNSLHKGIHLDILLHDVSDDIIEHDVFLFLEHELEKIQNDCGMPLGWPNKREITILSNYSNGLFIFAATACRFIRNSPFTNKSLHALLGGKVSSRSPFGKLDEIYCQVLQMSLPKDCDEDDILELLDLFRKVVGSIANLLVPLCYGDLAQLLKVDRIEVRRLVKSLNSVLDLPEAPDKPIRLLHPSFHDFLIDRERCNDTSFWVDEQSAHELLLDCCLQQMEAHLKRDMCNLQFPGIRINEIQESRLDEHLPSHVRYACRFWVRHLVKSNAITSKSDRIYSFLCKYFLFWLESLCLQRRMQECNSMINELERLTRHRGDIPNKLLPDFVFDAKNFAFHFGPVFKHAPLQLYSAALIFAPKTSTTRRKFIGQLPSWVKFKSESFEDWLYAPQPLEGHKDRITKVIFSPDGKTMASGSWDTTVKLWDIATGDTLHTLEGHSSRVLSVSFSPDGQLVGSASADKTVKLWNTATGGLQCTLEGHASWVSSMTFSPDGQMVASRSWDGTIKLWNLDTKVVVRTLGPYSKFGSSLAFSEDGAYIETKEDRVEIGQAQSRSHIRTSIPPSPISVSQVAVKWNEKPLLWLPPGFIHNCSAVRENVVVTGHQRGRVFILEFLLDDPVFQKQDDGSMVQD